MYVFVATKYLQKTTSITRTQTNDHLLLNLK